MSPAELEPIASATNFAPSSAPAPSIADLEPEPLPTTPEEALARLYRGNQRFISGQVRTISRERIPLLASGQKPFAAMLGCADSRVPIEFIFDQGFGDMFVTRIAGNIASSENIGSLEFGTAVLGAKVLYVLGHTSCGAVRATLERREAPGQISGLFHYIRPAVRVAGNNLELAVYENVRLQAQTLAEASPVVSRMVERKELIVAGGVYDLQTGVVTPVDLQF